MIRNLVNGLGIPPEALLQEMGATLPSADALEQGRLFPIAEMVKRGWFPGFQGTVAEAKHQLEELLNGFVGALGPDALVPSLNRRHVRTGGRQDEHALTAWRIRVATLATGEALPTYHAGTLTSDFLREVVRLSYLDSGPLLAREFLNKNGIHLICEQHLPGTHLDGAALKLPDASSLVALTLRHDRLDNFWFTLLHELAHVALHLYKDGGVAFFDDLAGDTIRDKHEKEADKLAAEMLIPEKEWKAARLSKHSTIKEITTFADTLRISPAIPAGRIRFEANDYTLFKKLIGAGSIRTKFGITWRK